VVVYKYEIYQEIMIDRIVGNKGKIIERITPESLSMNLYRVEVLEGEYKDGKYWFVEHEISSITEE